MGGTGGVVSVVSIVVALLLLVTVSTTEAQPVRRSEPNVAGIELLGRGLIYSVNYERYVNERVGIGFGLALWESVEDADVAIVPIYLSLNPVGATHSLYLGAGLTVGVARGFDTSAAAFGTATVGYQYRSTGGFIIRPAVSFVFADDLALPWPGITLARSF